MAVKSTLNALIKLKKIESIKSVLEFGSGLTSTLFINDNFNLNKFTIVEDQKKWKRKVQAAINKKNKKNNVELNRCLFTVDENGDFVYNFYTEHKFDLIHIDGPSYKAQKTNIKKKFKRFISEKTILKNKILKSSHLGSAQSIGVFKQSLHMAHKNTIFIFDNRWRTVIQSFFDYCDNYWFLGIGSSRKPNLSIKKQFRSSSKIPNYVYRTTIVLNKNSTNKPEIIKLIGEQYIKKMY